MADLSPEAQAVINAAAQELLKSPGSINLQAISAATLRAAAHQAIPETGKPNSGNAIADAFAYEGWDAMNVIRFKLLTIAYELEEHQS